MSESGDGSHLEQNSETTPVTKRIVLLRVSESRVLLSHYTPAPIKDVAGKQRKIRIRLSPSLGNHSPPLVGTRLSNASNHVHHY